MHFHLEGNSLQLGVLILHQRLYETKKDITAFISFYWFLLNGRLAAENQFINNCAKSNQLSI